MPYFESNCIAFQIYSDISKTTPKNHAPNAVPQIMSDFEDLPSRSIVHAVSSVAYASRTRRHLLGLARRSRPPAEWY